MKSPAINNGRAFLWGQRAYRYTLGTRCTWHISS